MIGDIYLSFGVINMRKNKVGIYALSALGLFGYIFGLTSCDEKKGDSSSESSFSSSSSESSHSSIDGHFEKWNDDQISLMKKYAGETLPYPTDMFVGEVTVEEIYDEQYDYSYLQISDEATSFTLSNYYETLESFGWSAITTYNGNIIQTSDSGTEFVETTKASSDGKTGYDILYFFSPKQENVPSCNVIKIYNDLSGKESSEKEWSSSDLETMNSILTVELPFITLGERHAVSQTGLNSLEVFDYYVKDLTAKYSKILKENGFVLDRIVSSKYDGYFLSKTLDGGAEIQTLLYYNNGNIFNFYYVPNVKESKTWPSEIISEVKERTGAEIPQFDIGEKGTYYYYKKNDSYCIYSLSRDEEFDYEKYAYNDLQNNLSFTWEEKISFATADLSDSNGDTVGFQLVINVKEAISTFVDAYPTDQIENILTDIIGVTNVSLPSFDTSSIPQSDKKIKYQIRGEEYYKERYAYYYKDITNLPGYYGFSNEPTEEQKAALAKSLASQDEGIYIGIYDIKSSAWISYEKTLYEAGWYRYTNMEDNIVYEDPTGKLAVTFSGSSDPSYDYVGATYIYIHKGSGTAHSPTFEYVTSEYKMAIGQKNKTLDLVTNMLPYKIAYSSSDVSGAISVNEDGEVSVSENAKAGQSATITAKVTTKDGVTYTATCTISVVDGRYYHIPSLVDDLSSKLTDKGYSPEKLHSRLMDYVVADLDSLSVSDAKKLVENSLIPEGFEKYSEEWEEGGIYAPKVNDDGEIEEEYKENGYTFRYTFSNDYSGSLALDFSLYIENGKTYLVIFVF